MDGERFITSTKLQLDNELDLTLRPKTFSEYVGQTKVKHNLEVFINAAKQRHESLDHVLLYGPPGLGKTTIAHIIANEMNADIKVVSGPALSSMLDIVSILTGIEPGDVLFIDEIHRVNKTVEEALYSAMEDFTLDIVQGKGPGARTIKLPLNKFTLVGATTRTGMLTGPMRDRFGVICRLELYSKEDLNTIIRRSAGLLNVEIDDDAADELAMRSRGTPRIANRMLKRVRDYAVVRAGGRISLEVAREGLDMLAVDALGLDHIDRMILRSMIEKFGGGPVGLDTLAAATGEDTITIEDVYEPYLLQLGFIMRTPRGRVVTALGCEHMGYPASASGALHQQLRMDVDDLESEEDEP